MFNTEREVKLDPRPAMDDESAVETWEVVYGEDDGEFYFLGAEVMGDLNNLEGGGGPGVRDGDVRGGS